MAMYLFGRTALMSLDMTRSDRMTITILLIVGLFVLTTACGAAESDAPASDPVESLPAAAAERSPTATTAGSELTQPTSTIDAIPTPTEPPLVNTPGPASKLAPDFTLPSIQGTENTLSQFRGDKPVAVVFYRAYW